MPTPSSCRQGTAGTMACNWVRRCVTLKVDGRDVGDILIAEHLAVPFICGKTSCQKTHGLGVSDTMCPLSFPVRVFLLIED